MKRLHAYLPVLVVVLGTASLVRAADVVAPAEVTNLAVMPQGSDVVLEWTPVTTNSSGGTDLVDHYRVYRGLFPNVLPTEPSLVGTTSESSFVLTGGAADPNTYYFLVSAVDAAGNEGAARPSEDATLPVGQFRAFGLESFLRATGDPVIELRSFDLLNPNTDYSLIIRNGGMEDSETEKVSSSIIALNGTVVLGPEEFNQNVSIVEAPVFPAVSNELSVELRGKPGGTIVIEIVGIDQDAPTISATLSPEPNSFGWNNTDVTVTFDCSDLTSGIGSCTDPILVTSEGMNQAFVGTAVDLAGNTATTTVTVSLDRTAPTVSSSRSPQPNANGWNSSDVTVSFDCSDGLSGVSSCSAPVVLATEGADQVVVGTGTDIAGNVGAASELVSIDKTPPLITAAASPGSNANGWNNSDVTVSFDCQDAVSAIAECTAPILVTAEGEDQSISGTATDLAGNTSGASITLNIDKTPPSLEVFAVCSPTAQDQQVVSGATEPGATTRIEGGRQPIETLAFDNGMYMVNVPLRVNEANELLVTSFDQADNESPAVAVQIIHNDELPPPGPGEPARINVKAGDMQSAVLGEPLLSPLAVIVTDPAGDPVSGVPVDFQLAIGSGTLGNGSKQHTVATDAAGVASTTLTMGVDDPGMREVRANFAGSQSVAILFAATGLEPAPVEETRVSGMVLTHDLRGIPGVRVILQGAGLETFTDASGGFVIFDAPPANQEILFIDASTATIPGDFSNLEFEIPVLSGQDNGIGRPIFLPDLPEGQDVPIDPDTGIVLATTVLTFETEPGLAPIELTVPVGTQVNFPPGSEQKISITRIPNNRIPMPLEEGRSTNLYVTIQPVGATFSPPLPISFPNVDGNPPGEKVLIYSFDHDVGQYVNVGTGTVSEDGARVTSDPGSGIVKGGWHGVPNNPRDVVGSVIANIPSGLDCDCWAENGQPCMPMTSNSGSTTACIANNLPVGQTTVAPSITEPDGTVRTVSVVECRCTFPLEVEIETPQDMTSRYAGEEIEVKGTASGTNTVTVDGTSVSVVDGSWSTMITLPTDPQFKTLKATATQNGSSAVDSSQISVITMELEEDGSMVVENDCVFIDDAPSMPGLRAVVKPDGAFGEIDWLLRVTYGRSGRNDSESFPATGVTTQAASVPWNIASEFGSLFRGGQAEITYKITDQPMSKTFNFGIRGENPTVVGAETYIGNIRWFDKYVAQHEGGEQNGREYLQFNEVGSFGCLATDVRDTPNASSDFGFGMYQLTNVTAAGRAPTEQELWNWQQNVDTGKSELARHVVDAGTWMTNQRTQSQAYNLAVNGVNAPIPVPDRPEGNCEFRETNNCTIDGIGLAHEDSVALKRFNGASGGNYVAWDNTTNLWRFNPLNNLGFNYVNRVCDEAPAATCP